METGDCNNVSNNSQGSSQPIVSSTYAKVTELSYTPKKEYAVIIDAIEGLTNDDYIDGLETLINVNGITHISKISGARVCVFLINSDLVDKVSNKRVMVRERSLTIRPYIEKNKRVVISNVNPVIPDYLIINVLKKEGITPVSRITVIRAGLQKPGRAHIQSFRRQVYITEEDEKNLPAKVQINYDDTTHWIYFSTDSTHCFRCKQKGHVAILCPLSDETDTFPTLLEGKDINVEFPTITPTNIPNKISTNIATAKPTKRPPSSSITSEESTSSQACDLSLSKIEIKSASKLNELLPPSKTIELRSKKSDNQKKPKIDTSVSEKEKKKQLNLELTLLPAKWAIDNKKEISSISYDNFKNFLEQSHGSVNVFQLARQYTNDIGILMEVINTAYGYIEDRSLKARLTNIRKKLLAQSSDTDMEAEQSHTS